MLEHEKLLINIKRGVGSITFNRLKQRNAFDHEFIAEFQTALEQMAANDNVHLITIAANGEFFCAGGDLQWFKNARNLSEAENIADAKTLAQLLKTLNEFPKPTVALVQGPAFGGGVGVVACCDIVLAAESASFCLSEVKLGLVPATIAPYVFRAIGTRQMRRYALSAESFSATEAQRIGLVHSVVSDKELSIVAEKLETQLLSNAPKAISLTKQLIQELPLNSEIELEKTATLLAKIRVSAEAQEGINAFLEKTKPSWRR